MKKSVFFASLLLFNVFLLSAATSPTENYNLGENKARVKINNFINKKFGSIKKFFVTIAWPLMTQKQIDAVRLNNNELREIRNIAEENIKSENNYKTAATRKAFIRYITQVVKKPVKKVTIEWKEIEKQVPITEFKDAVRKRYDKTKLKQNIYANIAELISKKSYDYAMDKTKSSYKAKTVQELIAKEFLQKIKLKGAKLWEFLGKNRQSKIDLIIEHLTKKGPIPPK